MKLIATTLALMSAFGTLTAAPLDVLLQRSRAAQSVQSSSGQFIVWGAPFTPASSDPSPTDPGLIRLDPNILAVTCERIKSVLLRKLILADVWRGRIFVHIDPAMPTNQAPNIWVKRYLDGWQYQITVPTWIANVKLVRGLIHVLLLEIANRAAGLRAGEIPLWLSEGLSQELIASSELELALPQPQLNINRVSIIRQMREDHMRDPLKRVRERLQTHTAFTFGKLGEPLPDPPPEETWKTFQASAQLFVHELLLLPGGQHAIVRMLHRTPFHLNWQTAFLEAFGERFPRLLNVEKWWAVVLLSHTGHDPDQAWTPPVALEKLDEVLHPPVLVSTDRQDLPQRKRMSLQQLIGEWDYLRQRVVLRTVLGQLPVLRLKTPPELHPLVGEYRATIEDYIERRDKAGMVPSLPGLARQRSESLAGNVIRNLNDLDSKRAGLSAADPPPAPSEKQEAN